MVQPAPILWTLAVATLVLGASAPILPTMEQSTAALRDREVAKEPSEDPVQEEQPGSDRLGAPRVVTVEKVGGGWRLVDELRWTPNGLDAGFERWSGRHSDHAGVPITPDHRFRGPSLSVTAPALKPQAPPV